MKFALLQANISELEEQLVHSVVDHLVREVEVVATIAQFQADLSAAESEAATARELAERRTSEAAIVHCESERLAAEVVSGGAVAAPGSLMQQFKIRADRAKAEKEAHQMAKSMTRATASLTGGCGPRHTSPDHCTHAHHTTHHQPTHSHTLSRLQISCLHVPRVVRMPMLVVLWGRRSSRWGNSFTMI
jgi:hypothetical protein